MLAVFAWLNKIGQAASATMHAPLVQARVDNPF